MGLLQTLAKGISGDKQEFKEKFKEAEMNMKVQKNLEEKQKSSNRRELERLMKQKEEEQIKDALKKIRKQENKENWKSKNMVLSGGTSILKNERPILKEKNIFVDKRNDIPLTKNRSMYFKW